MAGKTSDDYKTNVYRKQLKRMMDEIENPGTLEYLYYFLREFAFKLDEWNNAGGLDQRKVAHK